MNRQTLEDSSALRARDTVVARGPRPLQTQREPGPCAPALALTVEELRSRPDLDADMRSLRTLLAVLQDEIAITEQELRHWKEQSSEHAEREVNLYLRAVEAERRARQAEERAMRAELRARAAEDDIRRIRSATAWLPANTESLTLATFET